MSGGDVGFADPGSFATQSNVLDFMIQQALAKMSTSTLVQIIKAPYDRNGNAITPGSAVPVGFVDVQPMVNQINGDGTNTPHGTVYRLSYYRHAGANGAIITDPVVGDQGLMVVSDRDTSAQRNNYQVGPPASGRQYDKADGTYFGSTQGQTAPSQYIAFTANGLTVQDKNSNSLAMSSSSATLTANNTANVTGGSGGVNVNGNVGGVTITGGSSNAGVQINGGGSSGPVNIGGNLSATGNISTTGNGAAVIATNGGVESQGTAAQIVTQFRDNSSRTAVFYATGGVVRLFDSSSGDIVQFTAPGLQTNLSYGISYPNAVYGTPNHFAFGWSNIVSGLASISIDNGGAAYAIANGSDARLKANIAPSTFDCLSTVLQLQLRQFQWLTLESPTALATAVVSSDTPMKRVGLIAQEVYEIFPEGVFAGDDTTNQLGAVWNLDSNEMISLLAGAAQQLNTQVQTLTTQVATLETQVATLIKQMATLIPAVTPTPSAV